MLRKFMMQKLVDLRLVKKRLEKDRERSHCKENGACGRDVDSFVG